MANRVLSNGHVPTEHEAPPRVVEETTAETLRLVESALVDVRYALTQLRKYRDIGRAVDAIERVEETLGGIK